MQIWMLLDEGDIEVVTSELTLLETLVQPLKNSDDDLVNAYEELLTDSLVESLPITLDIIRSSAKLRANLNFKTPDALHAASALFSGCDILIANDDVFRRTPGITILILGDHIAGPV
jgi:predicted nucleic acid-binding protein